MWLCVECKAKFELRSLLLLHKSKHCSISEDIRNHQLPTINNLAVINDAAVHNEDPFHLSDDEDADPSYDPFDDVNDKKRKHESDSTSSDDDVGRDIDGDADISVIKIMTHSRETKVQHLNQSDFSRNADNHDHIEEDNKNTGDNNNNNDDLLTASNYPSLISASGAEGLPKATISRRKRQKGVRCREEEMKKKEQGLSYRNRKGTLIPAKVFSPRSECCKLKKCSEKCPPEAQEELNAQFRLKSNSAKHEVLCGRILILKKANERKRGGDKNRQISVSYSIISKSEKLEVCKVFFCNIHGITPRQVDTLVMKLKNSSTGMVVSDRRGQHTPKNKLTQEREEIRRFINMYPRNVSHYSRRETSEKIYLPSHLTIKKMHEEYKISCLQANSDAKVASYDVFRGVFKSTGSKFKQAYIDTCRKCDEFKAKKKFCTNLEERARLSLLHDEHIAQAEKGYVSKRKDKESATNNPAERVLVFDLQQVLSTPYLSTNIAYYKRLLSTYNLTVRDCSNVQETHCFMWHEAIAGRGSDQIASCVFRKIMMLPDSVSHITTYSDTCGGQNRNIHMAIMFSFSILKKPSICVIDQKFLLPGHTRLECDNDHARIERAKKQAEHAAIMTPRDWFSFVRLVSSKNGPRKEEKRFHVTPMANSHFLAFSKLLEKENVLIRRTLNSSGDKVEWMKIKWLRYESTFGVIKYKYTLDESSEFQVVDFRRQKRGRPISLDSITIPLSFSGPLPINPLKKTDLLSILSLIDEDCHDFYKNLRTSDDAAEFDEVEDHVTSENGTV